MEPASELEQMRLRLAQWKIAAERIERERRTRLQAMTEEDLPRLVASLLFLPAPLPPRTTSGLVVRQALLRSVV